MVDTFDPTGRTGLHRAAAAGDAVTLQLWLALGAQVDLPVMQKGAQTPLMLAAQSPFPAEAVRLLVEAGAAVNAVDGAGTTALKLLLDSEETAVAEYCVRHGANFNTAVDPASLPRMSRVVAEVVTEQRAALAFQTPRKSQMGGGEGPRKSQAFQTPRKSQMGGGESPRGKVGVSMVTEAGCVNLPR